ncbi:MAG: sigma-70 family RNA polymerase sigma factor [Cytophagales bacterium]|nr:sigma-70 family RNA polymerase sigma factor [Cytophagales bacterium]
MSPPTQNITKGNSVETDIVHYLKTRDKKALQLIFENYGPVLLNIILRIVKDRPMAQDTLQEVLIKIWKNGQSYKVENGSLFTWLTRVCRNAAIDKTRTKDYKLSEKFNTAIDLVNIAELAAHEEGTEQLYMRQMIDQLPSVQQKLIDLAYFQGYTQKEIAKFMKMPLGTVKTRIRLAIRNLRSII